EQYIGTPEDRPDVARAVSSRISLKPNIGVRISPNAIEHLVIAAVIDKDYFTLIADLLAQPPHSFRRIIFRLIADHDHADTRCYDTIGALNIVEPVCVKRQSIQPTGTPEGRLQHWLLTGGGRLREQGVGQYEEGDHIGRIVPQRGLAFVN